MLLSSTGESIFQLVVVFAIFIGIIALTYYTTKFIAGYQKSQTVTNNLEIIETIKLTTDKYVQIVRAGDQKYFVLAVGKNEVTLLGELSPDEITFTEKGFEASSNFISGQSFQDIFNKIKKSNTGNEEKD